MTEKAKALAADAQTTLKLRASLISSIVVFGLSLVS